MKLVIKVGTQSVVCSNGALDERMLEHLAVQIKQLQTDGHHIILVSSGAVGVGRVTSSSYLGPDYGRTIGEKQVLASIGQHELMHQYARLFKQHHLLSSQLLLTKQDFQTRQHYLNIARLLRELLLHKHIIPIVNENDSVGIEELMFTDNDELAGLIAAQINADKLILLTHVDGVFRSNQSLHNQTPIKTIQPDISWPEVCASKSLHGRGGMQSKLNTAKTMSKLGITTHIANSRLEEVVTKILGTDPPGTTILSSAKKSSIKRWLAFTQDKQQGIIHINKKLQTLLQEKNRIISVLPIGVETCHGNFKKGDLIEIRSINNKKIGVGVARYDAKQLNEYIGQQDKPVFVHYDKLHVYD